MLSLMFKRLTPRELHLEILWLKINGTCWTMILQYYLGVLSL